MVKSAFEEKEWTPPGASAVRFYSLDAYIDIGRHLRTKTLGARAGASEAKE